MCKVAKQLKVVLGVFLVVLCACAVGEAADNIKIDGKCDEWKNIKPVAEDPRGDVDDNDVVDYMKLWVVRDSDNLYISYTFARPVDWNTDAWRCNVFIDTDGNGNKGYKGSEGDWAIGADYLVQGGKVFQFIGSGPMAWEWKELATLSYSVDEAQVEIKMPYSVLGIKPTQKINILLHGDNQPGKQDCVPDTYKTKVIIIE